MKLSPFLCLAPILALALQGCGDCGCGGCGSESATPVAALPTALVLREADGSTVLEVRLGSFGTCSPSTSVSRFFRWNPMTSRAEPTVQGHQPGARTLTATTTGGGTDTYEDVAPGLTIRVASSPTGQGVTVTFSTATTSQTLTCTDRGGGLTCA
ncbi:MAG: hypothetical protein HY909_11235 [Deltaproteobacteria bacterium]|nr:hypothetical protein [Deltaproteobacteria bacterium]